MAPQLTEDEIDDLIYFSRAGEGTDLVELLSSLASRESVSTAEILTAAKDEGKSTCLHMATGNGHIEIVDSLLQHFSSRPKEEKQTFLDAPNEYGNTGLHWAAMNGHLAVVRMLVENGASPALANDKNYVPLDLAGLNDKVDVVDYFLEQAKKLETESTSEGGESLAAGLEGAELVDGGDEGDEDGKMPDPEAKSQ